jgi:hypothetical protein
MTVIGIMEDDRQHDQHHHDRHLSTLWQPLTIDRSAAAVPGQNRNPSPTRTSSSLPGLFDPNLTNRANSIER